MRIRALVQLPCAAVAFLLIFNSHVAPAQEPVRGPDSNMSVHIPGVDVLEIPGIPFTATSTTEWTRTLPDGSTVKRHLSAYIARDSSGRVYRERHHFAPAGATVASSAFEISVYDPTSSSRTVCVVASRRCVISSYRANTRYAPPAAGPLPNRTGNLTRDALGDKTIDGLNVNGTLETVTLNPGEDGNDRLLTSTKEFWYSPDLQTNLAVTRNDPSQGQQVITLSNVSRSEPEPSQFAVPKGYTVVDVRMRSPEFAGNVR